MPEEFDQTVSEAYDQLTAGDPGETPAAPPPVDTNSDAPADTAPAAGEGVAQPEGDQPFRWENVPPELVPLAKQFQGDYTRKAMELAEQRKALDAQQQQMAGWNYLQQLAQQDPAQAAALLQQYAAQLTGGVQAGQEPETDPFAQADPVTDTERLLLERNRAYETRLQQLEQFYQEQQKRAGWDTLNAQYAELERQAGRAIPEPEREQIAAYCLERGIKNLQDGYRSLYWDQEITRAKQLGRDEASTVVQQKAAAVGAPSALVSRTPTNAPTEFKSDREMIAHLYDELATAGT